MQELEKRHFNLLKKASNRGVKIRIASPFNKNTMKAINKLKDIADIRKVAKSDVAGRFAVVDNNHVVMALTNEKVHPTQDMSLWSQSQHVAGNILGPMFEMVWKQSRE